MSKNSHKFPHTISYRLSEEDYLKVQQEVANTALTPHDWCRLAVLDRLHKEYGLAKKERAFFELFARTQYLVANGFQLLADDQLTSEEWKKFRSFAKEKIDVITERALTEFRSRSGGEEPESNRRSVRLNPDYETRV